MAESRPKSTMPLRSELADADFDENLLATQCVKLMLNNNFIEAKEIFDKYKDASVLMSFGSSFRSFLEGVMTFEDKILEKALIDLKSTQRMCKNADSSSMFKSSKTLTITQTQQIILKSKIIMADCHLYIAVIHFLKHDVSGYVKGSWLLRKAWKIYERVHSKLRAMQIIKNSKGTSIPKLQTILDAKGITKLQVKDLISQSQNISMEELKDLYGSVCFGFGLFHLFVSLMPAKLLKLVHLIGFKGDRLIGLNSLEIAYTSDGMKAPLAMLSLLWYNTVARQFFAIDGGHNLLGVEEAQKILRKSEKEFPESSLVLFFKGRVQRCQREIDDAIKTFDMAFNKADGLVELQLLCCYENGWCSLINLQWAYALNNFIKLKNMSKWSLCYYTYVCALCLGVMGDKLESLKLFNEVPSLMKQKNNQLEIFIVRKAKYFLKTPITYENILLHIFELLYLWRALPNCTEKVLHTIVSECEKIKREALHGLKLLILGASYKVLNNGSLALNVLQKCMDVSDIDFENGHIAPYACFELAEIMLEHSDTFQKGVNLLSFCKENYAGYNFENRLQMRIHATEQRISNQIQSS